MAVKHKKRRRRDRQQRLRIQREQRKHRRKDVVPRARTSDGDFVLVEHPLSDVPRDELQEAMLKFSEDAASKLPGLQAEILNAAKNLLQLFPRQHGHAGYVRRHEWCRWHHSL
jgi:hypothetical protein